MTTGSNLDKLSEKIFIFFSFWHIVCVCKDLRSLVKRCLDYEKTSLSIGFLIWKSLVFLFSFDKYLLGGYSMPCVDLSNKAEERQTIWLSIQRQILFSRCKQTWLHIRFEGPLKKKSCGLPHKNLYAWMFTGEYSQQPKDRNNPNVHKLINGLIKCGIYIKWNRFQ